MNFKNKKILIYGFGKSGESVLNLLKKETEFIYIFDDALFCKICAEKGEFESKKFISKEKIFKNEFDYCILSPGVKIYQNEIISYLKKQNVIILSELEVGLSFCKGKIFGITGTNGKTTTSLLLYEIFKKAGKKTFLCGNYGIPVSSIARETDEDSLIVCEVSSFQLEVFSFKNFYCSAILNLEDDHLDRHLTKENYFVVKEKILKNAIKVINFDDFQLNVRKKRYLDAFFCSIKQKCNGVYINSNKEIFYQNQKIADAKNFKCLGDFNLENLAVCVCMSLQIEIPNEIIQMAINEFEPVEHRLEIVEMWKDILFVNDSKATNPESAKKAVQVFKENVILLLGGADKGLDFSSLIQEKAIKFFVLFGECREKIKKEMHGENYVSLKTFKEACDFAFKKAERGDVVLLSPGATSFDEFSSFEERGKVFKEYVKNFVSEQNEN